MTNRRIRLATVAIAVTGFGAGLSSNALAADADFVASANIQAAIAIAKDNDLDFGDIVPGGSADSVAVDTSGTRNCGAALTCLGTVQAAQFSVSGTSGATYVLTLPGAANIQNAGGDQMQVNSFVSSLAGPTGTLDGGGNDSFTVGATLDVGANQAIGAYSGTFQVTVEYQ